MTTDNAQSRELLIEELAVAKRRAAATDELRDQLRALRQELQEERAERYKSENALRMSQLIVEKSPVILFRRSAGENAMLEHISENISQFGYSPTDFLSGDRQFKEIVHPDDQERLSEEIKAYAEADVEDYSQVYRCLTRDGKVRWVEDQTSVIRDDHGEKTHNQGILIDITERKCAQDALRKSEEKFRRIVETAAEGFLLMSEDLHIQDANQAYCTMIGYSRDELIGKTPSDLATSAFKDFLLANRDSFLTKEYRTFEGTVVAKDGREIPLLIHGNTLRDDGGEIIGNVAFITDMTEQKKALILAGEVQKSLLPQHQPIVPGLDIAGRNVSCDEIGGDYYDFFYQRSPQIGAFDVVVGDISGHGVDSALLMTTARAFLRMRASQPGTAAEIVSAMNRHLAQDVSESGRFMTLFYLSIHPQEQSIEWVRAGHDPALIYDPLNDTFEELKGRGLALGVDEKFSYDSYRREGLTNGQILTVGTDGIWEAVNLHGEMFGKQRMQEVIRRYADADAGEILNRVYETLHRFTRGQKAEDDITLVIIKVNGLSQ